MRPKPIALMMGLAGIGVLGWTMYRSITESLQPFDARVVTERWASVLIVLGFGLLLGSLAVLLQPHNQTNSLSHLLFGTAWGALGAVSLSLLITGGGIGALALQLGCLGAEAGLLGGALFHYESPDEPVLFGFLYGMGAGTWVVSIFFLSLPNNLARIATHGSSLLEMGMVSALYGAVPGGVWGAIGSAGWHWSSGPPDP